MRLTRIVSAARKISGGKLKRVTCAGGVAVALLTVILLNPFGRPDSEPFQGVRTRLLDLARTISFHLRLPKAAFYLDGRFNDARLRDLYAAADAGRLVRRVIFVRPQPVDYGGIRLELLQWAATNQVQIILTSASPQALILYVPASDEERVQSYLSSLTADDLNPFE